MSHANFFSVKHAFPHLKVHTFCCSWSAGMHLPKNHLRVAGGLP